MSEEMIEQPVAWRWRYVDNGRPRQWIVRQSPIVAHEASPGLCAREVEPLYAYNPNERLREALEPFAKVADAFDYWCAEAMPNFQYPEQSCDLKFALEDCPNAVGELTRSDFDAARSALSPLPRGEDT